MKKWELSLVLGVLYVAPAWADYKTDIGFTQLLEELGGAMPTGAQVKVAQAEASTSASAKIYAPDTTLTEFSGKHFTFPGTPSQGASPHATGVGGLFYGNSSMAAGVTDVASFEANEWLNSLYTVTGAATTASARIANHSWVGMGETSEATGSILRLVDRQVQRNEYIQVVGMPNGRSVNPLLGDAYNVIAVGRTDGAHDRGSDAVDSLYVRGRTRPDLVAPQSTTSAATPLVSAAAALMVETGHAQALSLSNGWTRISGVGTVYDAERSETVKAALMAGADRETANGSTFANVVNYRAAGHQTANGLDDRFGAGQMNVYRSYKIIAGGEQDSAEDGGQDIGASGFDYDPEFGGAAGSNDQATYAFTAPADATLSASLAWNLGVANDGTLVTTLHDLDLVLFDTTTQTTVTASTSRVDNAENLWVRLFDGHRYEMRVTTPETTSFSWDFALAWHMGPDPAPVPLPAAVWLFGMAAAGIGALAGRGKA